MRQDYPKIRRTGTELVVFSPDSAEEHRRYGLERFGEELPYLFSSDPAWEVALQYGVLRSKEHPHGGFWNRSLWILDRDGVITHKLSPWRVSPDNGLVSERQIAEYQRPFTLLGAEAGEYAAQCGSRPRDGHA